MRGLLAYKPTFSLIFDLAGTPIDNTAWVELDSALDGPASAVEIYNPSGATLMLSFGAALAEDNNKYPYHVLPGGSSLLLAIEFKSGSRLSAKSIDANTANANTLVMNFFG